MTNYPLSLCDNIIYRYINRYNGQMYQYKEGSLGHGIVILTAEGKKTVIIKEFFINAWSSGHSVMRYNKTPKKYQLFIDNN